MKLLNLFIIMLLLSSSIGCVAHSKLEIPKSGQIPSVTFPAYKTERLSNGMKVYIVEDKRAPTLDIIIRIKSGQYDSPENTLIPKFVAELLDKGTVKRDMYKFNQEIDSLGGHFSAWSSKEFIQVHISGLNIYEPELIDLLSDALQNPIFLDDELQKEKRKQLANLQAAKEEPGYLLNKIKSQVIYGSDHPFSHLETPEKINSVSSTHLKDFHQKHFVSNNMVIAVVGDVDSKSIQKNLSNALSNLPKRDIGRQVFQQKPVFTQTTIFIVDRPSSVQSNIGITTPFIAYGNKHKPEIDVLVSVLGGGFSGRLFQNLRETHGWTYGSYSMPFSTSRDGMISHNAEVRNKVTASAITEILKEVKRIGTEEVSSKELDIHKKYLSGRYLLSLESSTTTAARLLDIDFFNLPEDFFDNLVKRYSLATASDLLKVSNTISKNAFAVVIVGNAEEIKSELEKFGNVIVYNQDLAPVDE